nr:hypothetical protein [Tanacetum cinerariifolium]
DPYKESHTEREDYLEFGRNPQRHRPLYCNMGAVNYHTDFKGQSRARVRLKQYEDQHRTVQSLQQWLLFSSASGNFLHWQWELLLAVGTL